MKEGKADADRAPDRTADAGLSEVGVEDQAGGGRVGEGTAAGSNGAEEPLTKEQAALKFIEEAPAEFFESGKSLSDKLKGLSSKDQLSSGSRVLSWPCLPKQRGSQINWRLIVPIVVSASIN